MISQATIRIARKTGDRTPLFLASFGEHELGKYVPTEDPTMFPYEHQEIAQRYAYGDPAEIVGARRRQRTSTWWGLYDGQLQSQSFIGMVGLRDLSGGILRYETQELGRVIFPGDARSKGIGTLALLASTQYATEQQGTRVLIARTSELNMGAQRSLARAGFSLAEQGGDDPYHDGSESQEWRLVHPAMQEDVAADTLEHHLLAAGWLQYQAQLGQVDVDTNS